MRILVTGGAGFIGSNLWNFYLGLLAYGMLTVLSEWRHISAAPMQKIGYVFTFPVFMFTYIPISIAALVRKVEWKPIYHTAAKKLNELGKTKYALVEQDTCQGSPFDCLQRSHDYLRSLGL